MTLNFQYKLVLYSFFTRALMSGGIEDGKLGYLVKSESKLSIKRTIVLFMVIFSSRNIAIKCSPIHYSVNVN